MTKCQEKQNHKRVTRRAGTARYAQNGKKRIKPNSKPKKVGNKDDASPAAPGVRRLFHERQRSEHFFRLRVPQGVYSVKHIPAPSTARQQP